MNPLTKKRPTISDVARIANVSTATVSRALQNPDVVSEATRTLVFDAVARTGYRANTAAQMLRQSRSGTILVVLPDIANPFFSEILSGIEDAATEAKYTILIGNTNGDARRVQDLLGYMRNGRADGALLMNGVLPISQEEIADLPLVTISEFIPGSGVPHVGTDNLSAAMEVTNHLIELGHRKIAHFVGPEHNILSSLRREGYEQAMQQAGLAHEIACYPCGFTLEAGAEAADAVLSQPNRPSAITCANDESAIGAISRFKESGVSVPDDISVAGFDDISFAGVLSPALTTVHQFRKEMGKRAMQLLLELMSGQFSGEKTITIKHDVVLRNSTARYRG